MRPCCAPRAPRTPDSAFEVQRAASLAALAHIYPPDRFPFPDDAIRERWGRRSPTRAKTSIVAERGDRIVGVAAAKEGRLNGLYVLPEEWGSRRRPASR